VQLSREDLLKAYHDMRTIRDFEQQDTTFDLRPFLPENVRDEFLEGIAHVDSDDARTALHVSNIVEAFVP